MNNTKIDWCDSTWNPVTGCLHRCPYCYARNQAKRFKGYTSGGGKTTFNFLGDNPVLSTPLVIEDKRGKLRKASYPFGFFPTFHRYRLDEPRNLKKPSNIFVCSMADLFGEWVPDEWVQAVFEACNKAPQHRYLFLTKNPQRYAELYEKGILPSGENMWFGSTATTPDDTFWWSYIHNAFVSIEPLLASFDQPGEPVKKVNWIIIGAETGNRKDKIIPKREWIETIIEDCRATSTPVFMKESLRGIMKDKFTQEYPSGLLHNETASAKEGDHHGG